MSGGRPKGTRNTSGHAAGGKRAGAGRLPKTTFLSHSEAGPPPIAVPGSSSVRETGPVPEEQLWPIFRRNVAIVPTAVKSISIPQEACEDDRDTQIVSPQAFLSDSISVDMAASSPAQHGDFFDSDFEEIVTQDIEDLMDNHDQLGREVTDDSESPTGVVHTYIWSLREKLKREMDSGLWPKCYQQGQFWIHPLDPYFAMHRSARSTSGLHPEALYHPSVFLWLPHLLDDRSYLCPIASCQNYKKSTSALTIKSWNDNPIARRVVTLDGVYYVMTKRIQCGTRAGGCGKSWNLYDSVILEQMEPGLAAAFPAFLTHRSGIDKTLMTLIRAGMAHRLSASAWADILRELSVRNHDLRELAYLHQINQDRKNAANLGIQEKAYLPFSQFEDKSSYAGFYPSRWYINSVYMDYMEHIRPVLDQCMSALTGHIIKWDHSFKLPKLLTKLNGVATFAGLFTLVNEFEQIRFQAFVPTKSLSHIRASLEKFSESLTAHGHPQPILGFTDNVTADAATFIQCIPSLGKDVSPVDLDEHPELPRMVLHANALVCETEIEIRSACDAILEQMPDEPEKMYVGFDMEWDFSVGQSGGSRATALVQIALPDTVFLLRTCFLKSLPRALWVILSSRRIIKIGRNIGSDLKKLARDFQDFVLPPISNNRFEGTIELGSLAKSKMVVAKATASLSAITAAVLHCHLSKESRATEWSASQLTPEQVQYAALDAWVGLAIWNALKDYQSQGLYLEAASPVGQLVSLFLRKQEVARGIIAHQPLKFPMGFHDKNGKPVMMNVSSTRTRALVTINEVLAPQVQLPFHKMTLVQLKNGHEEFDAVVALSWLRTRAVGSPQPISDTASPPLIEKHHTAVLPPIQRTQEGEDMLSDSDDDSEMDAVEDDSVNSSGYIQPSHATNMPSRILADVFHEIYKVTRTLSRKHSLHKHFATAMSDTMLVPDKQDKQNVELYLIKKGLKWDQVRKSQPDWLWKRVRRYIPEKTLLFHMVDEFFKAWGPVKCSVLGQPLFSKESWKKVNGVLHDIKKGYISDPSGIPIYILCGHDKNGLALYHSIRGTNSVEGGVHNPIRRNFASLNASVELADSLIADFRHRHNLDVGTFHKSGAKYLGHYDPWLDNQVFELRQDVLWVRRPLSDRGLQDTEPLQFVQTAEQFGIVIIPPSLRIDNDFAASEVMTGGSQLESVGSQLRLSHVYPIKLHLVHLKGKRKDVYSYLATAQQTKYAVTPVHTDAEFKLFQAAVSVGGQWFVSHGQPDFDAMCQWWSSQANGTTIFYKLSEHLSTHYRTWTERKQGIQTLIGSERQRAPNTRRLKSKDHSAIVLVAASRQNPGLGATSEFVSPIHESMEVDEYVSPVMQMEDVQMLSSTVEHTSPQIQELLPNQQAAIQFVQSHSDSISSSNFVAWSSDGPKRKQRTCVICHQKGCPGNANRNLCKQYVSAVLQ